LVTLILVVGVVFAAAGDLDLTFGAPNGYVLTNVTGNDDADPNIVIQPDGKIVIAGECDDPDVFCLVRYNPDGSLDTTGFGAPNGYVTTDITADDDEVRDLALQSDGKLVVAGECDGPNEFCIARYNSDGSLDTDFGCATPGTCNGYTTTVITFNDEGESVAIQTNGKIVMAGECASDDEFCAARYNSNGTLDTTGFGAPNGFVSYNITAFGDDFDPDVAIQSDGKIVLGGTCDYEFCVARLNTDGSLDTDFGCAAPPCNGHTQTEITVNGEIAESVAVQNDGKILLSGMCNGPINTMFCVARYNTNGTLDTAGFGAPNGYVLTNILTGPDEARGMELQSDEKIVVAGECGDPDQFCLARYNTDGSLDTTFGSPNGFITTDVTNDEDEGESIAIQADGKIVVAGECDDNELFCLVRYENDPVLGVDSQKDGCHFLTGISGGNYYCGNMYLKIPVDSVPPGTQANLNQCSLSIVAIEVDDSHSNSLLGSKFFDVDINCDNAPVRNFGHGSFRTIKREKTG